MADMFIISVGGTGAKVLESLVHLCAAGFGPDKIHLLLLDVDSTNGNLKRTQDTINEYKICADLDWKTKRLPKMPRRWTLFGKPDQSSGTSKFESKKPFSTKLEVTELVQPISFLGGSSGSEMAGIVSQTNEDNIKKVLDLLFDEDEQASPCEKGYEARPNLGCLIMTKHLDYKKDDLKNFTAALKKSAGANVFVVGSVFGGTGASIFPIIRDRISNIAEFKAGEDTKHKWIAVKMLPYYQPKTAKGGVDPSRYSLDSSLALQFYGDKYRNNDKESGKDKGSGNDKGSGLMDYVILIGSNDLSRNQLNTYIGSVSQVNPPFIEELKAAYSILNFDSEVENSTHKVITIKHDENELNNILNVFKNNSNYVNQFYKFATLGACLLRYTDDTKPELEHGLAYLLTKIPQENLRSYKWHKVILEESDPNINDISTLAKFFARYLLWGKYALQTTDRPKKETHKFLEFNYAKYYNEILGSLSDPEKDKTISDNSNETILMRLIRALWMVIERDSTVPANSKAIEVYISSMMLENHVVFPDIKPLPKLYKGTLE